MGSITASQVLTRVSKTLLDETNVQWSALELLDSFNAALRALVVVRPEAYTVNGNQQLVAGIKQTLPDATIRLIDVKRNMGANGSTPGRAIRQIDQRFLDNSRPDWPTDTASSVVQHSMYDPRDPLIFYVYPPHVNSNYVETVRSVCPPVVSNIALPIVVNDVYDEALYAFTIAHSYAKNSKRGDTGKMGVYLQLFFNVLGVKEQKDFLSAAIKVDGE